MDKRILELFEALLSRALTFAAGKLFKARLGLITNLLIRYLVKIYNVNMEEAQYSNISDYPTFNSFFTRALKEGYRTIDVREKILVHSADGIILNYGKIEEGKLLQAKGIWYTLESLLAHQQKWVDAFKGGNFITTYLSPRDYHKIHMCYDGCLEEMIYVPGKLFSVSSPWTNKIPCLFARNERVLCFFNTQHGPIGIVLIGALLVGSIFTAWHGQVNTSSRKGIKKWKYDESDVKIKKGAQLGHFEMGSTVILLLPHNTVIQEAQEGKQVYIGKELARWI